MSTISARYYTPNNDGGREFNCQLMMLFISKLYRGNAIHFDAVDLRKHRNWPELADLVCIDVIHTSPPLDFVVIEGTAQDAEKLQIYDVDVYAVNRIDDSVQVSKVPRGDNIEAFDVTAEVLRHEHTFQVYLT